jgi:hypothetical protein
MLRARAALLLAAAMIGCSAEAAPKDDAPVTPVAPVTPTAPKEPVTNGPMTVPQNAFNGASAACGDLFAYRASDDGTQIFGVTFEHARDGEVIDLGASPPGVLVTVDVFGQPATSLECNALAGPDGEKTTWVAEAGRLETLVGDHEVAFMLEDVHLVGPEKGFAVVVPRVFIAAHR